MSENKNTGAGKGDAPRNCFSKQFKDNYEAIDWSNEQDEEDELLVGTCDSCGSQEEPYYTRVGPMGYFCPDCGEEVKSNK